MTLFQKMRGAGKAPPRVGWREVGMSWLGAFLGMVALGALHEYLADPADAVLLVGSLGASAVLLYGAPKSPLAQPRNLLAGHVLSALVGVSVRLMAPTPVWLCAALAVATAIAVMHLTRSLHPPGGATALIAVIGGPKIVGLGYMYALVPVACGALVLLVVALLVNNASPGRRYPEYWW